MKSRILSVLLLLALLIPLVPSALCPSARATEPVDDQIVTDAYIYLLGRYLVIRQEKIDQELTKVGYNTIKYNPLGKADFINPNMDVASLEAWLAVDEKTPALLTVPKITGRYYTVEIIDEWGNIISNINPRETPDKPYGNFVFLLKGSHPPLPKGATPIELPSKKAKLLARIALQSTPSEAAKLQYDFKLRSLGKPAIAPPLAFPVFPNSKLIGVEIFDNVARVLASAADRMPIAPQLQDKVRAVAAEVTSGPDERKRIAAILKTKSIPAFFEMTRGFGTQKGGWSVAYTAGDYGDHFELRTIGNYLIPFLYRFKHYLFQAAKRAFFKADRIKSYPVREAMHSAVSEFKTASISLRSSSKVPTVNPLNLSLTDCHTRSIGLPSGL